MEIQRRICDYCGIDLPEDYKLSRGAFHGYDMCSACQESYVKEVESQYNAAQLAFQVWAMKAKHPERFLGQDVVDELTDRKE